MRHEGGSVNATNRPVARPPRSQRANRLFLLGLLARLRVDPRVRGVGDLDQERQVVAAERGGVVPLLILFVKAPAARLETVTVFAPT